LPVLLRSLYLSFAFPPKINLGSLPAGDNSLQKYFFFVLNVRDEVCDEGTRANNMVGAFLREAPRMLARYDVFLFPAS